MKDKIIDHLFRHHSGKMVAILTRIFGLQHLEIIEDAVQDTFIKATLTWGNQIPDHPETWLTKVARNRVLDILRTSKTQQKHLDNFNQGTGTISIHELFLDTEIEDAQLRMIFTACHPQLDPRDRISFALKTVSGFSSKEISSALLTKEETVKKRLLRAKRTINKLDIKFKIPQGKSLPERLESVMEVLYLIFNEGFHSSQKQKIIRKDLCVEAVRLTQLLLKKSLTRTADVYALCALMYFHSARLDSKLDSNNELLDLKNQNRKLWYFPLIRLGDAMMNKAVDSTDYFSCYHYEAAIASEHLRAKSFEDTDWSKIHYWYQCLYDLHPMPSHLLSMAVVCIQDNDAPLAKAYLDKIKSTDFEHRSYLYYGTLSDYFSATNQKEEAIKQIDLALEFVTNELEKDYLQKKRDIIVN